MIREARSADAERLRTIERAAGARFADVGMADIAAAEPMAAADLAAYAEAGRSWVAVDDRDRAVGYVVVDVVDGYAHIEQISVDPNHQGQGLARALIAEVDGWARRHGMTAMTLTTFADVPWNRPLYEHLGFSVIGEEQLPSGLAAVRAREAAPGLDPATRVCMHRGLRRSGPSTPERGWC